MKEEIRMEKLMKYVEEMQKEWINICWPQFQQYDLVEMCLISKHYWLIKWLVDNDKIDFDNRDLKDEFMLEFERYPVFQGNTYNWDFNENGMIMLLSIQEDPISFLISVLKQDEKNSTRN